MVDISPDRHTVEIGRRGLQSISRAREFLDRELLKGETLRLRRASAGEEEDEERAGEEGMAAGGIASTTLLQEMESAKALFFVVEDRSPGGPGAGGETGAAASGMGSDGATGVAASSHETSGNGGGNGGGNDSGSGSGSAQRDRSPISGGGGEAYGGDDDGGSGSGSGGGSACATAGGGDYSLPYWGLVMVGEQTNDPGDTPEPWPLYGVSGDGEQRGGRQRVGPAVPRSQLPPPAQVHRPANVPNSVGYRIVFLNVKVSIHHPRGSAVAANKDAVIDRVTRVRQWLNGHSGVSGPCAVRRTGQEREGGREGGRSATISWATLRSYHGFCG